MDKRIIVDSSFKEETRVAFINGTEIEHFEVDTSSNKKQLKGNVYLAKVSRVEPSLQAAFINYGGNKQGFLPFSEISNDYFKIPESDKNKINSDIEELKKVKDSDDIEAIKSKTEALVQSSIKLGEAIYKQNPQGAAPQPDPSGAEPSSDNKDEKVVDADFEEVDENKKD